MNANGLLSILQECLHMYYSWKIIRKPFACMVILQSMWIHTRYYLAVFRCYQQCLQRLQARTPAHTFHKLSSQKGHSKYEGKMQAKMR